jgi:pimeloyl-ACP methyl ester carboxylesterase
MPIAVNHGVPINYDIEGQGAPLVLMHGFSGNRTSWRGYGFVDALKLDYQLILLDARGHGESGKPHDPEAYADPYLLADVIAVLDARSLDRAHFLGYSMGGEIGFGLAKYYPHRLRSLIVGGASPYNRISANEPHLLLDLYEQGLSEGVDGIIASIKAWAGAITPEYEARLRTTDIVAAVASLRWYYAHLPYYGDVLHTITLPCLIYAGDQDEPSYTDGQECVAHLPHATFLGLPGRQYVAFGWAISDRRSSVA